MTPRARRSRWLPLVALSAALACATSPSPPSSITLAADPVCPLCAIRLDSVTGIHPADSVRLVSGALIARDTAGRFYTHVNRRGTLFIGVFAPDGGLAAMIPGPGRIGSLGTVTAAADGRVFVYDPSNRAIYPVTDSLTVGRVRRAPESYGFRMLVSRSGRIIVNGLSRPLPADRATLHVLDDTGGVARSFSPPAPDISPEWLGTARVLAPAKGDRFWAASVTGKTLELWDTEGRQHAVITRPGLLYSQYPLAPEAPPSMMSPFLATLREDVSGLLWAISVRAGPSLAGVAPGTPITREQAEAGFEVLVEVIDPARGVVVAAQRFPFTFGPIVGSDLVGRPIYDSRERQTGLTVWRLVLDREGR